MWAAENLSPGVIAVSESAGDPLRRLPRWKKLCRYLCVLALLSVIGVGICVAVAITIDKDLSDMVLLLVLSPFVVPGLLALYLCTRNCCGLILNLVFAFSAILTGIVLFAMGIVIEIGVMFMVVGGLILIVIIITLVYNRVKGQEDGEEGEFSSGHYRDILFGDEISQQAYPNCAPLKRLESSIRSRTGSVKKKLRSEGQSYQKDTTLYQPEVQFIIPEIPPPSGQHSRCSPERIDLEEIALTTPEEGPRTELFLQSDGPNTDRTRPSSQNCFHPSPVREFTSS